MYCDGGWSPNGVDAFLAQFFGQSCYQVPNLAFAPFGVKTHTQATTATRAPGKKKFMVPTIFFFESICRNIFNLVNLICLFTYFFLLLIIFKIHVPYLSNVPSGARSASL